MTGVMTMACSHGFVSQPGMAILASASNVMTNVGMVRISAMTRRLPRWSVGCPSMSDVDSPSAVTLPSIVTPPSVVWDGSANPPSVRSGIAWRASELGNSRNNAQVAMDAATIDTAAKNRSNPIVSLRVGLMHFAFG